MKIHGITLVKNEADIIELFLQEASKWCDAIYVFDNGSEDDTWHRVRKVSESLPDIIVPHASRPCPFRNELRAEVFQAFRERAEAGDWWCRLDADEFYIDSPRTFLSQVPKRHHVVWSAHFQYYLTHEDVDRFKDSSECPIHEDFSSLPRHYACNASEARFFRHRKNLVWRDTNWPRHMGINHPKRIRLKHYQYRSPGQIQKRLDTRRQAKAQGYDNFSHSLEESWVDKLANAEKLHKDDRTHAYAYREEDLPNHLEKTPVRLLKYFLHGTGIWP